VLVAPSKSSVGDALSDPIIRACKSALESRDAFTIALSGGSLPSFLKALPDAFERAGVDPQWNKWYVLMADERCVPSTDHPDSNHGAIRDNFLSAVPIRITRMYGIHGKTTEDIASHYEGVVKSLLGLCDGMLDCAVLGFGPDGHTCSLFPGHPLLEEQTRLVAPIEDSPKPPSRRITLTFPVLNKLCRQVVFCGAGSSKTPILKAVFGNATEMKGESVEKVAEGAKAFEAEMTDPAPYPCGMVRTEKGGESLVWVVDADAAKGSIM